MTPGRSNCTIKATLVLMKGLDVIKENVDLKNLEHSNFKVISPGYVLASVVIDHVEAANIMFRVVPDDSQATDVLIGRSYTELPHIVYLKMDGNLNFYYRNQEFQLLNNLILPNLEIEQPTTVKMKQVQFQNHFQLILSKL